MDEYIAKNDTDQNLFLMLYKKIDGQKVRLEGSDYVQFYSVDPTTKENPSNQINVLMIGDSFTGNNFLPWYIKYNLTSFGFLNYNFIGGKSFTKDGLTVKHDGYSGYCLRDMVKTDNSEGKGLTNPYLKDGVVSLKNKHTESIDLVIVELGINDVLALKENRDLTGDIKKMANIIRADYPNAKILVVGGVHASKENDFRNADILNLQVQKMNAELKAGTDSISNCDFVDVSLMFQPRYGYQYEVIPAYPGSDQTIHKVTDYLHPSKVGYRMEAECITAKIVYDM